MKIVVAPDSFKGSITARDLCAAISAGIKRVLPNALVTELPLADGGEGTMENMVHSTGGTIVEVMAKDPLGRPILASYGILGDRKTVIIELAQASGLPLLEGNERNPLITTSFGTGELLKHALDGGYRSFVIGLGGSATNDGGMGLLKALGVAFYDKDGNELPQGGEALNRLASIDDTRLDVRVRESVFMIASDVTNPLYGPNGASAVFGPQKGASPNMVAILDRGLQQWSRVIYEQKGIDVQCMPGSGAAGGAGAALLAFLHAELKPGIDIVMESIQFERHIKNADAIITGEGKLDQQTLSGKVIAGVCKKASRLQIPVIALCGGYELSIEEMDALGLSAAFSIVPRPCSLEEAIKQTKEWSQGQVEQIFRVLGLKESTL